MEQHITRIFSPHAYMGAFTQDINCIHLYGSCDIDPLKFGTWALAWEWTLAQDTIWYDTVFLMHVNDIYIDVY